MSGLCPGSVHTWWDSGIAMLSVWWHLPDQCLQLERSSGGGLQGVSHTHHTLTLIVCGHKQCPLPVSAVYFRPLVSLLNFSTHPGSVKKNVLYGYKKAKFTISQTCVAFQWPLRLEARFRSIYLILLVNVTPRQSSWVLWFQEVGFFQLWFPRLSTLLPHTSVTTETGKSSETDKLTNGHFSNIASLICLNLYFN